MGLKFKREGSDFFEIDKVRFSKNQHRFLAKNKDNTDDLEFFYPLERSEKYSHKPTEFSIFLFHKDDFATNDIFQIKLENRRIGWLFPIQALLSSEHNYSENEHFLPYSYNAYKILLENDGLPYLTLNYDDNPTIDKIYGENTIIFIVFNKYLRQLSSLDNIIFKIEDYLTFFYSYGYTLINNENYNLFRENKDSSKPANMIEGDTLSLKPLSSIVYTDINYISSLILGTLKFEKRS